MQQITEQTFSLTLSSTIYDDVSVHAQGTYIDGSPALGFVDDDGPIVHITVHFPGHPAAAGCVWARDWSEASGLVDELVSLGIAERTGRTHRSGFATAHEVRLLGETAEMVAALLAERAAVSSALDEEAMR